MFYAVCLDWRGQLLCLSLVHCPALLLLLSLSLFAAACRGFVFGNVWLQQAIQLPFTSSACNHLALYVSLWGTVHETHACPFLLSFPPPLVHPHVTK